MNETAWLAYADPQKMLGYLRGQRVAGARPLRLFACACCRRLWPSWLEEPCRRAVETAERHADGQATRQELADAHAAARRANRGRFDKRGGFTAGGRKARTDGWSPNGPGRLPREPPDLPGPSSGRSSSPRLSVPRRGATKPPPMRWP